MTEFAIGCLVGCGVTILGVFSGIVGYRRSEMHRDTEPAAEPVADEEQEEQRRSKEIDEGIQNLMTFSVNGKDGFDVGGL